MPRGNKPKITYGKALRSPSKREEPRKHAAHKMPMKKPQGLSKVAEYVEENKEYRDNTRELVQEFQTEECDHPRPRVVLAHTSTKEFLKCPDCGDIQEKARKNQHRGERAA